MNPHAACGPPWMFRSSGYFFDGSKSGGRCTHACTRFPSKLVYQISSGGVMRSCAKSASLNDVRRRGFALFASNIQRSPTTVGEEMIRAIGAPARDALYDNMA